MAVLGISTLTGCDSIPSFIVSGTRMIFEQAAAPAASWTKETNAAYNDIALRVTTSSVSSGGSLPFVTVFPATSKGLSAYPFSGPSGLTLNPSGTILSVNPSTSGASTDGATISVTEMRSHAHQYQRRGDTLVARGSATTQNTPLLGNLTYETGNSAGGGGHSHGIQDTGHTHGISSGDHSHPFNEASHTHQFQMTARNFSLLYMDVIICTKD